MTSIGIDLASVDKNILPNYAAARAAGVRFAIPRAVYGRPVVPGGKTPYLDPVWARDKNAIRAAKLKRSAYLFLCFEKPGVYTPSPQEQADAFIRYVSTDLEPFVDFVPFVDVEESTTSMTSLEMFQWIEIAVERLASFYKAFPGIYTSQRVWTENLKSHPPGSLVNCPLWLAKPWPWATNTMAHLDGAPTYSPTLIPQFGNQWSIYQYQGDAIRVPGFSNTVDLNRFREYGQGAKGENVVWTQRRLGTVDVDGIFGPKTKIAVQELQSQYKLITDGIIGVDTFAPLCWSSPSV